MKKYRILSIDDSKAVHAFLTKCLSPVTLSIDLASNGEEGIAKFKKNPGGYDLIFLDWEMPVLNGPETFHKLTELGIKIPVLMLTSKNNPSDIMQMIDAGVADYILKPFTEDVILGKVNSVMGED